MFQTFNPTDLSHTGNYPAIRLPSRAVKLQPAFSVKAREHTALHIQANPQGSIHRSEVEHFIQQVFHAAHQASLSAYLPLLFSLHDRDQSLKGAVGLRMIEDQRIFLEQYLLEPIEQCVAEVAGVAVQRSRIVEVGNLASVCAGSSRQLIAFLVYYLKQQGIEWAVCTGTSAVRAVLKRMGIGYQLIEKADPQRLGEQQHQWGSYYEHNPFVLAVNIEQAWQVICSGYEVKELNDTVHA